MQIGYRFRIFDMPLYATGSTILTPADDAVHSDPFAVTSLPSGSITGYQAYLRTPRSNRGQADIRTGRSTVGTCTIEILDKRIGTGNDERWMTAFIGDDNSKLTIIGKKGVVEETLDGGTTWSPYFVGRVNNITLSSPLVYAIELGDPLELLKQNIFEAEPAVDYITYKSLLPVGYTNQITTLDNGSTIQLTQGLNVSQVRSSGATANDRWLRFDNASINRSDNAWSAGVISPAAIGNVFSTLVGQNPFRCLIQSGSVFRTYQIRLLQTPPRTNSNNTTQPIEQINVLALPVNDPLYSPITDIKTTDTNLKVWVYRLLDDEGKAGKFYVNETPYQILRDILDGKFFNRGFLFENNTYIDNSQVIPYDTGSIDALETAYPLPKMLYKIEKPMSAVDFIEKDICQPFSLGYTFVPASSSGNFANEFRLFSTQQPTAIPSITFDNTNIVSSDSNDWQTEEPILYVKGTFYVDNLRSGRFAVPRPSGTNNEVDDIIETITGQVVVGLSNVTDASYKPIEIDMNGVRGVNNNLLRVSQQGTIENLPAYQYTQGKALRYLQDIYNRHKSGNPTVDISVSRLTASSDIADVETGDFVLISEDVFPNQATQIRGGTRLYQIIQKNPDGAVVNLSLVDSGVNETMNQPSFGALSKPRVNVVSSSITTTDDALVEIEYAARPSGSAQPAATSNAWVMYQAIPVSASTAQFEIEPLPEGHTIYLRARSVTPDSGDLKLPSSYVYSSGITLDTIPSVTNLAVSNITARSATVTWDNTSDFYSIELLLASPAGVPDTSIITLRPSSSRYQLFGLNSNTSTSHTVGVRYTDEYTGFGPMVTASFTATGTAPQLDDPAALILYIARD
jgi:hypothetical protein